MKTIDTFIAIASAVGTDANMADIKKRTQFYTKYGYAIYPHARLGDIRVAIPIGDATPPAAPRPASEPTTEESIGKCFEDMGMKMRVFVDKNSCFRANAKWQGTEVAQTAMRPIDGKMRASEFRDMIARELWREYINRYGYE